ncbi:AraC family transcriptional regulator [Spongiimicrobium salis]|uniref:AraC family transcriptional regulator n=1 Tax=Spongiimicrobium salis TaxID=1667022 RepID=UPI00374D68D0
MDLEQQLLFFFSALGAFNGLVLSGYFAFFFKERSRATYFLAALLFVISVRVAKSVFFTFSPTITNTFLHIGLTACLLIGPFLYLYVNEVKKPMNTARFSWLWHVLPILIAMLIIHYKYPYHEYRHLWQRRYHGYLGWFLFAQWFCYIGISGYLIRNSLKACFTKSKKSTDLDFWLVNVVLGVGLIWLAYFTTTYTSYIVGALSFSFVIYLIILLFIVKKKRGLAFLEKTTSYQNKKIGHTEGKALLKRLDDILGETTFFKKDDFKLGELAELIEVTPHYLSQFLNDNLGVNFPNFINSYRINAAMQMIKTHPHLTLEAIGKECGFKSKTSFYKAFKKENDMTPATYRKTVSP